MPIEHFPNGLSDDCAGTEAIVPVGNTDRDSLKVPMVGSDGLECRSIPLDAEASALEPHVFETRRCREVDR